MTHAGVFDPPEPLVRLKPESERQRRYVNCLICGGYTADYAMDDPRTKAGSLVCRNCASHWGRSLGLSAGKPTRGDRRVYQRLSAVVEAIIWETKNGKFR